jgi:hypothetical protein
VLTPREFGDDFYVKDHIQGRRSIYRLIFGEQFYHARSIDDVKPFTATVSIFEGHRINLKLSSGNDHDRRSSLDFQSAMIEGASF